MCFMIRETKYRERGRGPEASRIRTSPSRSKPNRRYGPSPIETTIYPINCPSASAEEGFKFLEGHYPAIRSAISGAIEGRVADSVKRTSEEINKTLGDRLDKFHDRLDRMGYDMASSLSLQDDFKRELEVYKVKLVEEQKKWETEHMAKLRVKEEEEAALKEAGRKEGLAQAMRDRHEAQEQQKTLEEAIEAIYKRERERERQQEREQQQQQQRHDKNSQEREHSSSRRRRRASSSRHRDHDRYRDQHGSGSGGGGGGFGWHYTHTDRCGTPWSFSDRRRRDTASSSDLDDDWYPYHSDHQYFHVERMAGWRY